MPSLVSFVRNLLSRSSHSTSDIPLGSVPDSPDRPTRLHRRATASKKVARSRSVPAPPTAKLTLTPPIAREPSPSPNEEDKQAVVRSASMRVRPATSPPVSPVPMSQNPRRQSMRRKPVPSIVPDVPPLPSLPSAGSQEAPPAPSPPTTPPAKANAHPAYQIHVVKPSQASIIDITHDTPLPSPAPSTPRSAFLSPQSPYTPSLSSTPCSEPSTPHLATPGRDEQEQREPFPTFFPMSYSAEPETSYPDIQPRGPNRSSKLSVLSWGKKIPVAAS